MQKSVFQRLFFRIFSFIFSLAIAILIFFIFFLPFSLIVHESGHILGGVIYDISTGRPIQNYTFSIRILVGPYFSIPRQTSIPYYPAPYYPATMILGGPITFVLLITLISAFIYVKTEFERKKFLFLIPIYAFITAIINDYICGTDNLSQKALHQCQNNIFLSGYLNWGFLFLILIFLIILYPFICKKLKKIIGPDC
jgi:hypothetical protein